MTEKEKIFRKVALRFVKDAGLFRAFHSYYKHYSGLVGDNFFKTKFIDEIFGEKNFTDYLENKFNFRFGGYTITTIFRTYVNDKYGDKFEFRRYKFIEDKSEWRARLNNYANSQYKTLTNESIF